MNAQTGGVRVAVHAAWEKLPEIIIASIVALFFFGFRGWVADSDHSRDIAAMKPIVAKCHDYATKADVQSLRTVLNGLRVDLVTVTINGERHMESAREWKDRIVGVENQIYELRHNPQARPDAFTLPMGISLQERIEALEGKSR